MNTRTAGLLLTTWLLAPALALAQPTAPQPGGAPAARSQMYEDVEVLRRLLNGKLQNQYKPLRALNIAWKNQCTVCHGAPMQKYRVGFDPHDVFPHVFNDLYKPHVLNEIYNPNVLLQHTDYFREALTNTDYFRNTVNNNVTNYLMPAATGNWQDQSYWLLDRSHSLQPHYNLAHWIAGPDRLLDTEGVYLKGQGVVYTLTLPPPPPAAKEDKDKPAPKAVSDWDRVRNEVRQEKQATEKKPAPPREQTLPEIVLKLLAENGRHFAQLSENESITVVITFRRGDSDSFAVQVPAEPASNAQTSIAPGLGTELATTAAQAPTAATTSASSANDYELLGDLQQKQAKYAEAVAAYYKALELKPEGKQAITLKAKLAQLKMAEGKYDAAERLIQEVLQAQKEQANPPKQAAPSKPAEAPPSPLPGKLIIVAPRRLLDQFAGGKMTLEEFQKQATVETINSPAPQK